MIEIKNAVKQVTTYTDMILNQLKPNDIPKFGWYLLGRSVLVLTTCGYNHDEIVERFKQLLDQSKKVTPQ